MFVDASAAANADAGGSTIALCERCSGELIKRQSIHSVHKWPLCQKLTACMPFLG